MRRQHEEARAAVEELVKTEWLQWWSGMDMEERGAKSRHQ